MAARDESDSVTDTETSTSSDTAEASARPDTTEATARPNAAEASIGSNAAETPAGTEAAEASPDTDTAAAPGTFVRKKARRSFRWSNLPYTVRVTVSFACIAAMTALVAFGVVSFVWEMYFQTYTTENMRSMATTTANRIAILYERTGQWTTDTIQPAVQASEITSGIGVKVFDVSGDVLYDSSVISQGNTVGTHSSLEPSDSSRIATANITVDNEVVGSVHIWVYGSDTLMRQPDQEFRNNSYQAMLFASLIAIVLAVCIGFLFARNLVSPINRMTAAMRAIEKGDLSARTGLSGTDEISHLGETFDAMAEAVERDRELERRLTTDVAHELRTPLMAIQATVEAMVDGVYEADEERLSTVNAEVQRLSRLVDAILKLSRLENRSTPMKEEVVDLNKLVSDIIVAHEMFVTDSGLSLSYEGQENVFVVGDPDMIRQAVANLISNAVRYTPEGGSISVTVKSGDIMASIAVSDTGIGLTREEAKMVFSRFWRADSGRTRESGGLGVGLAVVKEIVDRHGGWVQVEGEQGKGACFTIHLPLYDEKRTRENERQAARRHRNTRQQQS